MRKKGMTSFDVRKAVKALRRADKGCGKDYLFVAPEDYRCAKKVFGKKYDVQKAGENSLLSLYRRYSTWNYAEIQEEAKSVKKKKRFRG